MECVAVAVSVAVEIVNDGGASVGLDYWDGDRGWYCFGCGRGGSVKQLRLPVNGTYALETRNEQSMLYDCDWTKNTLELYNFIYE